MLTESSDAVSAAELRGLADDLELRLEADPPTRVVVLEDDDLVESAAWLTPFGGTSVAAHLALDLGYRLLQVDASDDSRPILERLGLTVVGGTTPYVVGRPTA